MWIKDYLIWSLLIFLPTAVFQNLMSSRLVGSIPIIPYQQRCWQGMASVQTQHIKLELAAVIPWVHWKDYPVIKNKHISHAEILKNQVKIPAFSLYLAVNVCPVLKPTHPGKLLPSFYSKYMFLLQGRKFVFFFWGGVGVFFGKGGLNFACLRQVEAVVSDGWFAMWFLKYILLLLLLLFLLYYRSFAVIVIVFIILLFFCCCYCHHHHHLWWWWCNYTAYEI